MTPSPAPDGPAGAPASAILLIVLAGFILAGMDAGAKYLGQIGAPVLMVIWARYFFHSAITFVAYAAASRSLSFLKARRPGLQFVRAMCLFIGTVTFYTALAGGMPLADAASIQFLAPVLVTAFSGLFLGEKVGPRRWTAVVIAFTGVLIVAQPGAGTLGLQALLPLCTAVVLAVYMILTRRIGPLDSQASTTFYTTGVGAVVLTLALPAYYAPSDAAGWGLMALMGAAGALGHYLIVRAFHAAEASALAPFTYSQIVGAILWGYIVFADIPSLPTLAGAALIVGSGIYVWYRERTLRRRAARPGRPAPSPHPRY